MLLLGDCLEQMKTLEANSMDAVVTDPPYGLSFMGKRWDYDVPSVDIWREVFRVLKPGGHVLSFGGTRTYHRMVVNIEDAGFEIRDQVQWIYGSGFPKSHNVSKAIDKMAGVEREVIGINPSSRPNSKMKGSRGFDNGLESETTAGEQTLTAPATSEAKQWDGWGSALKPANEPICLARKPLEKGLTIAENVLKWGCGALNINGTRIGTSGGETHAGDFGSGIYGDSKGVETDKSKTQGRWPANILFDEAAAEMLDEMSGTLKSGARNKKQKSGFQTDYVGGKATAFSNECQASEGGASRFFYCAKSSKAERNRGCEGMVEKDVDRYGECGQGATAQQTPRVTRSETNHHPTVKPIKLMEYLCKLITPPDGTILDPFMGSGSTGVAAKNLGFEFIGIERDPEYMEIAKRRIEA